MQEFALITTLALTTVHNASAITHELSCIGYEESTTEDHFESFKKIDKPEVILKCVEEAK